MKEGEGEREVENGKKLNHLFIMLLLFSLLPLLLLLSM